MLLCHHGQKACIALQPAAAPFIIMAVNGFANDFEALSVVQSWWVLAVVAMSL